MPTTNTITTTIEVSIAQLACIDIYDPISPGIFDKIYRIGETVCGVVLRNGVYYVINQGTENWSGWLANADFTPFKHSILGNLYTGFYMNLPALIIELKKDIPIGSTLIMAGHSKGGAESLILAALMELDMYSVQKVYTFGAPHPGNKQFASWMAKNIPGVCYRNAPDMFKLFGDPVPMVPIGEWIGAYPLTYVDASPGGLDDAIDIDWHEGPLYVAGIKELLHYIYTSPTEEKDEPKLTWYAKLVLWLKTLLKKI